MSYIVHCPNCGQKNKLKKEQDSAQAICAKCWTRLVVPETTASSPPPPPQKTNTDPPNNSKSPRTNLALCWILFFVFSGGLLLFFNQYNDRKPKNNLLPEPKNIRHLSVELPEHSKPSYPQQPIPINGATQLFIDAERIAPLEIQTSQGSNYLVKLVSKHSQKPVMTIFIRGGNNVNTNIPLGVYEIKYASGELWYGYKHLFGPKTSYAKTDKLFTFENTGYQISGYTITLYKVPHGNLRTFSINAAQF